MAMTEFKDLAGKPIFDGDVVQYRLGKFGKKSGGPQVYKVRVLKKKVYLSSWQRGRWYINLPMRKNLEQYVTIIDTSERKL